MARRRRRYRPPVDTLLWDALRSQFDSWKFRRDMIVGPYVVDFLSLERLLVIEIESERRPHPWANDVIRTEYLKGWGYRILRLYEAEIAQDLQRALQTMKQIVDDLPAANFLR